MRRPYPIRYGPGVDALVRELITATPPAADDLAAWRTATQSARGSFATPVDRALVGGAHADRLGFAFAGGYAEALRALVPGATDLLALCATEEGGAHPRAIKTTLERGELTGRKKWATGAASAAALLVVASTGTDVAGHNQLRVVRVPTTAPGLRLHASAAAFVPEITHAEVELDHVRVADADVLPGDGYTEYLKPFRTVEDAHVHAALAGYLIGLARRRGWRDLVERLLAVALATREVALADPKAATTHVALAGVLALAAREVTEVETRWRAEVQGSGALDDEHTRWLRDRALLQVAAAARAARRERAWEQL